MASPMGGLYSLQPSQLRAFLTDAFFMELASLKEDLQEAVAFLDQLQKLPLARFFSKTTLTYISEVLRDSIAARNVVLGAYLRMYLSQYEESSRVIQGDREKLNIAKGGLAESAKACFLEIYPDVEPGNEGAEKFLLLAEVSQDNFVGTKDMGDILDRNPWIISLYLVFATGAYKALRTTLGITVSEN